MELSLSYILLFRYVLYKLFSLIVNVSLYVPPRRWIPLVWWIVHVAPSNVPTGPATLDDALTGPATPVDAPIGSTSADDPGIWSLAPILSTTIKRLRSAVEYEPGFSLDVEF